jgi:hypothetical protein
MYSTAGSRSMIGQIQIVGVLTFAMWAEIGAEPSGGKAHRVRVAGCLQLAVDLAGAVVRVRVWGQPRIG